MYFWGFIYVEISFFLPLILLHTPTISHLWHFPRQGPQQRSCSFLAHFTLPLNKILDFDEVFSAATPSSTEAQALPVGSLPHCLLSVCAQHIPEVATGLILLCPVVSQGKGSSGSTHASHCQRNSRNLAFCICVGNKTKWKAADNWALYCFSTTIFPFSKAFQMERRGWQPVHWLPWALP